jgi:chromosome segregation ATPase
MSSIDCRQIIEKGAQFSNQRDSERLKKLYEVAKAQSQDLSCKVTELNSRLETQSAAYKAELEHLQQVNKSMQLKLSHLSTSSDFSGIVEMYETVIQSMKASQTATNEQLVALTKALQTEDAYKTLAQSLLKVQHDLISKEAEVARLQSFERKWVLSRRCVENLNKRAREMHGLIDKQASALEDYEFELNKTKDELEALRASYRDISVEAKVTKDSLDELQGEFQAVKRVERTRSISRSPGRDRSAELIMKQLQRELMERRQHACVRIANDLSTEIQGLFKAIERAYAREQNLVARLASVKCTS